MDEKIWTPHKKQVEALKVAVFELLYGGARGGGKTDAGIMWMLKLVHHPQFRGLVIRKNANDLSDWVDRARNVYTSEDFQAKFAGNPAEITFPSGAIIRTGHLKDDNAYEKYQGHEYHRILIEELTHIPNEEDYLKLISSCRSTIPELKPRVFATTNPGGRGHAWVKKRFVDMGEPIKIHKDPITGRGRIFIPATVDDNPTIVDNDPHYVRFLEGLPEDLKKAWRYGDWDVFTGQFFKEWKPEIHVCRPFDIPKNWQRYINGDYGFAKPSAVYWNAIEPESGKVYTYRELYVTEHTGEKLAEAIVRMTETDENVDWLVMDSNIKDAGKEGGRTILDQMEEVFERHKWDLPIRLAKKGTGSRMSGWDLVRGYLRVQYDAYGNPKTRWQIFDNCENLIRVMPLQQYDENKPEDLDSDLEDHAPDSARYGFQALAEPFTKPKIKQEIQLNKTITNEELYHRVFGQVE